VDPVSEPGPGSLTLRAARGSQAPRGALAGRQQ